jgi:hypothetical protein
MALGVNLMKTLALSWARTAVPRVLRACCHLLSGNFRLEVLQSGRKSLIMNNNGTYLGNQMWHNTTNGSQRFSKVAIGSCEWSGSSFSPSFSNGGPGRSQGRPVDRRGPFFPSTGVFKWGTRPVSRSPGRPQGTLFPEHRFSGSPAARQEPAVSVQIVGTPGG